MGAFWHGDCLSRQCSAVLLCGLSQHKPSCEAEESWGDGELCAQSLFWVCEGFVGCTGAAALCNLLVLEVLSARHRHQTAEASELAEKLWHFSSFAGQNYSFQSGDCAMAPWGNPWVQMCCFCQLVFILWGFFPLSPDDKAAMMLWIGLDLWKSQYMAYFKAKGVGWLTAVAHSPACVFLREEQWVNVSSAAPWKYLS